MERIKTPLDNFKKEIRTLIEEKNRKNYNLNGVTESVLTPDDMKMYYLVEKLKKEGGSAEELIKEYEFEKYRSEAANSSYTSRKNFAGFLADELTPILLQQQSDAIRQKKAG